MIYSTIVSALTLSTITTLATANENDLHCTDQCLRSSRPGDHPLMETNGAMQRKINYWTHMKMNNQMGKAKSQNAAKCVNGMAGEYPCSGLDLISFISLDDLGCNGGDGSDMWGWTDAFGSEYAMATCETGTSMVDITDPTKPIVLGFLPTNTGTSWWFDAKTYNNYVYIGSEAVDHGMSVFDLTQLTTISKQYKTNPSSFNATKSATSNAIKLGVTLKPNLVYKEFGSSHNMVINTDTGYLYAVGSKTCDGGLHIVDIRTPYKPTFVGCYANDGYTHDAECVVYKGPDTRYTGHEICFNYNEDTLTIVDVTDKSNIRLLARQGYTGATYTHQGWLNPEQTHLFMNDELDEEEVASLEGHTRSMIWDVNRLDAPKLIGNFYSSEQSIDHNEYIHNGVSWQSNYCAGLRVLDARYMDQGTTSEVAYFDVSPKCSTPVFLGAWSAYPYWKSGVVGVQTIERGLFLLQPTFQLTEKQ